MVEHDPESQSEPEAEPEHDGKLSGLQADIAREWVRRAAADPEPKPDAGTPEAILRDAEGKHFADATQRLTARGE